MQDQVTAPDGPAVPSQDDLDTRVSVLEEGLTRVVSLLDQTVTVQSRLLRALGDARLLVDVAKSEVDR